MMALRVVFRVRFLLINFFFLLYSSLMAVDLTKTNLVYQYDDTAPIHYTSRISVNDSLINIYFRFQMASEFDEFKVIIQDDYEGLNELVLTDVSIDTIRSGVNEFIGVYRLPKANRGRLLVFAIKSAGRTSYFDTELNDKYALEEHFLADGIPATSYYGRANNLRSTNDSMQFFGFAYRDNFPIADSPFGAMKAIVPSIQVDTVFKLDSKFNFEDFYFYFIQKDTNSAEGFGIYQTPASYPKLSRVEDLIPPLEYISTKREFGALIKSQNIRTAFQDFWLKNTSGQEEAKLAIRRFYRKVSAANRFFTTYKQGWKSDQGMIYSVYGCPDEVNRTDRKEIWRYKDGTQFEFIKISTLFAPRMYSLVRNKDYEETWVLKVTAVRKGQLSQ